MDTLMIKAHTHSKVSIFISSARFVMCLCVGPKWDIRLEMERISFLFGVIYVKYNLMLKEFVSICRKL
jgi:hypothetical protein